jgi:hypothetical protein
LKVYDGHGDGDWEAGRPKSLNYYGDDGDGDGDDDALSYGGGGRGAGHLYQARKDY